MSLPYFFIASISEANTIILPEETSKHCIQVLRMKEVEKLQLTDGKDNVTTTRISDANKRHCLVNIEEKNYQKPHSKKISIAISLLKNTNRFEWFLEKATEIGVREIIPLICERTEKQKFRYDRMKGICISAMLQSQQAWLPVLHEPVKYMEYIKYPADQKKFIAHCDESSQKKN